MRHSRVTPSPASTRAAGLLLGHAADRLLGDPRRFHPVAGFGTVAGALERRLHADSRARGAAHTLLAFLSTSLTHHLTVRCGMGLDRVEDAWHHLVARLTACS